MGISWCRPFIISCSSVLKLSTATLFLDSFSVPIKQNATADKILLN